jgi:hypothetical protein
MKKLVMMFLSVIASAIVFAQPALHVTHNKTTHVVFPVAITGVDRGSQDIVVQKATGAENILKVKSQKQGFAETNLSVVTSDGKVYTFTVNYDTSPSELIVYVGAAVNKDAMGSLLVAATGATENSDVRESTGNVRVELTGAYVHGDMMLFRYRLSNYSSVDYDVDQLRFYIKDRKRSKRTAQQETEIAPLQSLGESTKIKSGSQSVFVIAVPKFTISNAQEFITQMQEANGARHFHLSAKAKHLKDVQTIN